MAILGKLRDSSKPIIWFVIIAFVVGLAGVQLFSYISNNKLNIFGMSSPNRYSMVIDGEGIAHTDTSIRGSENGLDYLRTFYGLKSSFGMPTQQFKASTIFDVTSSESEYHDIDIYNRHIQTEDELKSRIITDKLYEDLFNNNLSDIDVLIFLISETETPSLQSNVGPISPIQRILSLFNRTYFIDFEEPFTDLLDGQWNPSEKFEDLNNNGWRDSGESFTDSKGNGVWDEGEDFTDAKNGIYDEGEDFIDDNENSTWDEGEDFTDTGDGIWNNGMNKWLEHCVNKGEIDYTRIHDKDIAQRLKNYIKAVASYYIKNKKYELAFNSIDYNSELEKKQSYLFENSNAIISYISYDFDNFSQEDAGIEIKEETIQEELPEFDTVELGYFSNAFLIIVLILFIIFSIQRRNNRGLLSLGTVVSVLLGLIVIFKLKSDSNQGTEQYKQISYIYLDIDSKSEDFTDLGNGIWDEGEDFEDLNDNGLWDQELLTKDVNGNGILDQDDEFEDLNNDGTRNKEPLTDEGNKIWNLGEEFTDSNGNGKWDSKESLAQLEFESLITQIEASDFNTVYDAFENKKDKDIILSKQITSDNIDNLKMDPNEKSLTFIDGNVVEGTTNFQLFGSIIFELLDTVFKTDKDNTFIINHNNARDGSLEGYLIGYISDEGNYFEKTEYDKLEKDYIEEFKEKTFLAESSFLERERLIQEVQSIQESGEDSLTIATITQNYNDVSIDFGYGNESLVTDPLIKGYISQMKADETSEIVIGDGVAYIIYMLEPSTEQGLFMPEDYKYNKSYDTFSNLFQNIKNNTNSIDWRNEAYYVVGANNPNQDAGSINDIYFNLDSFEAALKTSISGIDFNIK